MLEQAMQQNQNLMYCIKLIFNNKCPVVDIMENLFFLVVAAILLAVSVYFLISYLKDRKKTKLTFNKRKW
jgi:Na+/melibiose symporter-like transporter